ncbi:MAG: DUF4412 domain-containing protein [bacterium]
MKKKKVGFILLAAVCCCMFPRLKSKASEAEKDLFFEKETQTLINGEPAGPPKILKVWLKGNRIRYASDEDTNTYVLILMDKGKSYEFNKLEKTFKESTGEMAKVREMSEHTMVISKRTGQKKKIGEWNCYEVTLDATIQKQKIHAFCWLTEDIHISQELMQRMAKFTQMKLMEELAKFPGYPVKMIMDSTVQNKNVRVVNTLTHISKEPLKADFFKIPFDFTKINP